MCSDRSQCTQGTRDKWVQSGNDQGWRIMFLPADRSWLALFHQLLSFKLWNFQASSVVSVWLTIVVAIKINATHYHSCSLLPSVHASLSVTLGTTMQDYAQAHETSLRELCMQLFGEELEHVLPTTPSIELFSSSHTKSSNKLIKTGSQPYFSGMMRLVRSALMARPCAESRSLALTPSHTSYRLMILIFIWFSL